jgi:hypothetical protein
MNGRKNGLNFFMDLYHCTIETGRYLKPYKRTKTLLRTTAFASLEGIRGPEEVVGYQERF